eukprot:351182-Pyramimonas_sp.AAC.1
MEYSPSPHAIGYLAAQVSDARGHQLERVEVARLMIKVCKVERADVPSEARILRTGLRPHAYYVRTYRGHMRIT